MFTDLLGVFKPIALSVDNLQKDDCTLGIFLKKVGIIYDKQRPMIICFFVAQRAKMAWRGIFRRLA